MTLPLFSPENVFLTLGEAVFLHSSKAFKPDVVTGVVFGGLFYLIILFPQTSVPFLQFLTSTLHNFGTFFACTFMLVYPRGYSTLLELDLVSEDATSSWLLSWSCSEATFCWWLGVLTWCKQLLEYCNQQPFWYEHSWQKYHKWSKCIKNTIPTSPARTGD